MQFKFNLEFKNSENKKHITNLYWGKSKVFCTRSQIVSSFIRVGALPGLVVHYVSMD